MANLEAAVTELAKLCVNVHTCILTHNQLATTTQATAMPTDHGHPYNPATNPG